MKTPRRKGAKNPSTGWKNSEKNSNSCHERKSSLHHSWSEPKSSVIRKPVDPDTSKYFTEISNSLGSDNLELEERSVICCNALEEAQGKELELATDYILSHTIETLLEGSDLYHLCGFLRATSKVFSTIAIDRSGSHVAESGLKSLAKQLQDEDSLNIVEETLEPICKAVAVDPIEIMCNSYGSHVVRSLICLLGGVALDSPEFHGAKRSQSFSLSSDEKPKSSINHRFPTLLKRLVLEIMKSSKDSMNMLQDDPYGSLVLQTMLKLLEGHDDELLQIIPFALGCVNESLKDGSFLQISSAKSLLKRMKQTSFSHLLEVVIDVSPDSLFHEMLTKLFESGLFKLSLDQCGNFVVQALLSRLRTKEQMELIWQQLGAKFEALLSSGKSGVVASLLATSQRLHIYQHECAQSLAEAVSKDAKGLVPHTLFLDHFFSFNDRSSWIWPDSAKIHVMGSLILQTIFSFNAEIIKEYVNSMTLMEDHQIAAVANDSRGSRVIESFLSANISVKTKRRLISKLRGRFGELAAQSSGSYTIEKCFAVSNLFLREAIARDLLEVRNELAKTKQGPYLLRKMDIECLERNIDEWRKKQESKQSTLRDFYAAFGSNDSVKSKGKFGGKSVERVSCENEINVKKRIPFLSVDSKKRFGYGTCQTARKKIKI